MDVTIFVTLPPIYQNLLENVNSDLYVTLCAFLPPLVVNSLRIYTNIVDVCPFSPAVCSCRGFTWLSAHCAGLPAPLHFDRASGSHLKSRISVFPWCVLDCHGCKSRKSSAHKERRRLLHQLAARASKCVQTHRQSASCRFIILFTVPISAWKQTLLGSTMYLNGAELN